LGRRATEKQKKHTTQLKSRNDTTVIRNSLYCCSAMELYSLGAGRYSGFTEFLIFIPILQLNSTSKTWIDQERLIEFFLQSLTDSQPADAL